MNYAFLSRLIPTELKTETARLSKHNMQDAADALQRRVHEGLCRNLGRDVVLINALPLGSYPQYYKRPFVKRTRFETPFGSDNINVGHCNVKTIKNFCLAEKIWCELRRWLRADAQNRFVFIYTLSPAFLTAVERAKKEFPDLKTSAIVADLPNMASLSSRSSLGLRTFQRFLADRAYSKLDCVDAFVLLTRQMADYMKLTKPFCVMEGIATRCDSTPDFAPNPDKTKRILYSGTLHKRFGILNLLEAFERIENENFELIVCGVGDSEKELREAAVRDRRVKFLGQRTREEALRLQREATVLVNPRQNVEEFTKYSFPSKNLEYLSSGKPLVGYKLDGIPDEYDPFIFYVDDNSVDALRDRLIEVCSKPSSEIETHCRAAFNYVQEKKNEIVQTQIILDMLAKENLL